MNFFDIGSLIVSLFVKQGNSSKKRKEIPPLWPSYIFTGAAANIVSWLVLPRNAVSVGTSGAVFRLFAISVLVKVC